jgi:hypothetical protein
MLLAPPVWDVDRRCLEGKHRLDSVWCKLFAQLQRRSDETWMHVTIAFPITCTIPLFCFRGKEKRQGIERIRKGKAFLMWMGQLQRDLMTCHFEGGTMGKVSCICFWNMWGWSFGNPSWPFATRMLCREPHCNTQAIEKHRVRWKCFVQYRGSNSTRRLAVLFSCHS